MDRKQGRSISKTLSFAYIVAMFKHYYFPII